MKGGRWRIAICVLAFCSLRTNVFADPILLTFDEVAPGTLNGDLYRDLGVFLGSDFRFDGGGGGTTQFSVVASDSAVSAPNILRPRPPSFAVFTDISAVFLSPGGPLLTDSLSMAIVGAQQAAQGWSVQLIGLTDFLETISGTGNQVVSIKHDRRDILGFLFLGTGPEGLDNVRIGELTPVPEPGTLVLVGLGLAGIARGIRLRR